MATDTSTWRGTSRQERDQQRRERLLTAGLELFGTTGYQACTVASLCSAATVSTRHFYELYPDRSRLLATIYTNICDALIDRITSLEPPDDGRPDWLRASVERVLAPLLDDVRTIRILEVEMVGADASLEQIRQETTARIVDALSAWHAALAPASDPHDSRLAAIFIEGGMSEALVAYARGDLGDIPKDALLDRIAALVERLLR